MKMSRKILTIEEQFALVNSKMELIANYKSFRDSVAVTAQDTASSKTVKEEIKKYCDKRIEEINGNYYSNQTDAAEIGSVVEGSEAQKTVPKYTEEQEHKMVLDILAAVEAAQDIEVLEKYEAVASKRGLTEKNLNIVLTAIDLKAKMWSEINIIEDNK